MVEVSTWAYSISFHKQKEKKEKANITRGCPFVCCPIFPTYMAPKKLRLPYLLGHFVQEA
jgi:hypothetical protein